MHNKHEYELHTYEKIPGNFLLVFFNQKFDPMSNEMEYM